MTKICIVARVRFPGCPSGASADRPPNELEALIEASWVACALRVFLLSTRRRRLTASAPGFLSPVSASRCRCQPPRPPGMSAPAPTIRTRKFLTNRLMGRKQFVRATHSPSPGRPPAPPGPLLVLFAQPAKLLVFKVQFTVHSLATN